MTAECPDDWLTIVRCQEGALVVSAGQNPVINQTRTARVSILLSDRTLLAEVTVTQSSKEIPVPVD